MISNHHHREKGWGLQKFVRNLHEPMGGEFMQIYEFVFGILFASLVIELSGDKGTGW